MRRSASTADMSTRVQSRVQQAKDSERRGGETKKLKTCTTIIGRMSSHTCCITKPMKGAVFSFFLFFFLSFVLFLFYFVFEFYFGVMSLIYQTGRKRKENNLK